MKQKGNLNKIVFDPASCRPSTAVVWTVNIGLLLVAVGTLLPIIHWGLDFYRYIYGAGAIVAIVGRILSFGTYRAAPLRVRRLSRTEFWASVMFGVATFFMFYPRAGATDWLAFTLAGAALQAYASLMLPRTLSKAQAEKED
ncbi:MAG: hypothetical protein NC336_08710 [Clostridium sp.]|nr:hypothetical protein [Clostridium sp.]